MATFTRISGIDPRQDGFTLEEGQYIELMYPGVGRGYLLRDSPYSCGSDSLDYYFIFPTRFLNDGLIEGRHAGSVDGNKGNAFWKFLRDELGTEDYDDYNSWVIRRSLVNNPWEMGDDSFACDLYKEAYVSYNGLPLDAEIGKRGYRDFVVTDASTGEAIRGFIVVDDSNHKFCIMERNGEYRYLDGSSLCVDPNNRDEMQGFGFTLGYDAGERIDSWSIGENTAKYVESFITDGESPWNRFDSIRFDCDSALSIMRMREPESAVEVISDNYERETDYRGMNDYHDSHSEDFRFNEAVVESDYDYRMGIELEVECKSSSDFSKCKKIVSNFMFKEEDGSLSSKGIEFISVPLRVEDACSVDFWRPLCDVLRKYAESKACSSTGLHVHIGRECLGDEDTSERDETFFKLVNLYFEQGLKNDKMNIDVYGRERTYNDHDFNFGDKFKAAKQLDLKEIMKVEKLRDTIVEDTVTYSKRQRYFDINNTNNATIEFRKGKGSISPERIAAVCTYSRLMVEYVRENSLDSISIGGFKEYVVGKATKENGLSYFMPIVEY